MSNQVQQIRGTTAQRMAMTPVIAQLVYDTTLGHLFVGDGVTVGGIDLGAIAWSAISGKPSWLAGFDGTWDTLGDKPTIPSAYTLPAATATVRGGVKVTTANGLALNGDTLSFTPAAGATKTLRNVATRCRHDYQLYTGSNLIGCYGRTGHQNLGDSVDSVQVVVGNWYANNVNEFAGNAAVTEWISIEYPAGAFTLATWSAASGVSNQRVESFSNPVGADAVTDPINIHIPQGATFWVRRVSRWTDGTARQFSVSASAVAAPPDTLFFGFSAESTVNDVRAFLTSSIAPTGPATMAQVRFPLAVLGMSSVPSVMLIGDSRLSGRSDANQATVANNPTPQLNPAGGSDFANWGMGEIARSIGHKLPYVNLGCETDAARTFNTVAHTFRARQQAYHTDIISEYGINDVNLGNRTAAATQVDLAAIYALFPTKRVWQSTISPVSTSTDSWATVANQTTATTNAQRILLNNWIRTKPAPLFGFFEVADVLESARDSGIWNVVAGLGAPTGDGLHETPPYYKLIDTKMAVDPARIVTAAAGS